MPTYMVERSLPGATMASIEALRQALGAACHAFAVQGRPVRYLRSVFTPGDSRCRCLFEAPGADLVQAVNEAAQVPYGRILLAVDVTPETKQAEHGNASDAPRAENRAREHVDERSEWKGTR